VVLRPGASGSYDLSLVFGDGRVVGPVSARLRTVRPAAGSIVAALPVVSSSDSRVYFLDGDTDVRFLARDGSQGAAARVPGGLHTESAFAVSADDRRLAVATLDASADPATMRLSVEDLAGGGEHVDLPAPTDSVLWPVGWHAGQLVVAVGSAPTRNVADNPYGTFGGYRLLDPATGARLATIDCDPAGALTPAGTACLGGSPALAVTDFSGRAHSFDLGPGASAVVSAAESPDGDLVAICCISQQLQLWDLTTDTVRGLGPADGTAYGWVDATHLLVGDAAGLRGTLLDVRTGSAVTVAAWGRVVARMPGGL